MRNIGLLICFFGIFITSSCNKEIVSIDNYGIFSSQDETVAIVNGVIGSNTPQHWDNYIAAFPATNMIIMQDCPGSEDDAANIEASRKIKDHGVAIHLTASSEIASGAVDMFLAGTVRTMEAGSKIGVHAWSNGSEDATAFPVGHAEHQLYIDYYLEMGFSQEDAEAFYYFTIEAAPSESIHWMTTEEIDQYKLLTP